MVIFNKAGPYYFKVSTGSKTFLGFEMTADPRDISFEALFSGLGEGGESQW